MIMFTDDTKTRGAVNNKEDRSTIQSNLDRLENGTQHIPVHLNLNVYFWEQRM